MNMIVHSPVLCLQSLQQTAVVSSDHPSVIPVGVGLPRASRTNGSVMVLITIVMGPVDSDILSQVVSESD
jgi:hypothetical protein